MNETNFFVQNRKKIGQAIIRENKADLIIVGANSFMQASMDRAFPFAQDSNFYYLSGLDEPNLILVITDNQEYLIVPKLSESRIAFEGDYNRDEITQISGVEKIVDEEEGWRRLEKQLQAATKVYMQLPPDSYIASMDMFTNPSRRKLVDKVTLLNSNIMVEDLKPFFVKMRSIKSAQELDWLGKAIDYTQKMFEMVGELYASGVDSETVIHAKISEFALSNELNFAYDPIIAGGKNAATLHYVKNNMKLNSGELLLLDLGLKYKGYSADITRTIAKKPTNRQSEVYLAVLEVQKYAINLLKPGVTFKEYETKVNEFMGKKLIELKLIKEATNEQIRKYYPHSTSHFLGLDVHDVGDYQAALQPGMVLTVEPGIYIPEEKIGIRIEDNILITEDGHKNLTNKLPRDLTSLRIK